MDSKLRFQYDREGDILHIEKKPLPTRSNAPMSWGTMSSPA